MELPAEGASPAMPTTTFSALNDDAAAAHSAAAAAANSSAVAERIRKTSQFLSVVDEEMRHLSIAEASDEE